MKNILSVVLLLSSFIITAQNIDLSESLVNAYYKGKSTAVQKSTSGHNNLWLTPILTKAFANWDELTAEAQTLFNVYSERPVFSGTELTYTSGNYLFHYTTTGTTDENVDATDLNINGVPDYVESIAEKFAQVYVKYHTTLFLTVPPGDGSDGGNSKYDVYLSNKEAGAGTYGWVDTYKAVGDNPNSVGITETQSALSFMVMRSNYNGFGDVEKAISVTVAHEYMHSIQAGYSYSIELWFMEASSTWAEEYAFPGYDDNFQYLIDFFDDPDVALNFDNDETPTDFYNHWYSTWLLLQYLTEQTNNGIVKELYERCITQTIFNAINSELSANWDSDFANFFSSFIITNAVLSQNSLHLPYVYNRADEYNDYINSYVYTFYENSSQIHYTGTDIVWDSEINGNKRLMRLSSDNFKFSSNGDFRLILSTLSTELELILVKKTASGVSVRKGDNGVINVTDYDATATYIPIVIRGDVDAKSTASVSYTLKFTEADPNSVFENNADKVVFYPNPVESILYFNVDERVEKVVIKDVLGNIVSQNEVYENSVHIGDVPAGMYFVDLYSENKKIVTGKMLFQ